MGGRGINYTGKSLVKRMLGGRKPDYRPIDVALFGGLKSAETVIRKLDREHALVYGKDIAEPPIGASVGTAHSVALPPNADMGTVITHNHPNKGWGGTFSYADIAAATTWNDMGIRAAAKEGTYYLKPGKGADPYHLARALETSLPVLQSRMNSHNQELLDRVAQGKITNKQAKSMQRQVMTGVMHRFYKRIAEQNGYIYGRQKLNKARR